MSWLPNRSIDMRVKQLKSTTQTVTGGGQVVVFTTTADLCGSPTTTYNSSTGRFTLPDTPCILRAGLSYQKTSGSNIFYIDVQFYDATNAQYIGSKGRVFGYRPDVYYASYNLSCDEDAVAVAQNIEVECRITAFVSGGSTLVLDGVISYSNLSRVIIQEMHS